MCGLFCITFDKTGFPLVARKQWNFAISLLPVSKYQFERFLVDTAVEKLLTDAEYRQILALNERISWRSWRDQPWRLFLTGLLPHDTEPFLRYLGRSFSLPNAQQCMSLFEAAEEIRREQVEIVTTLAKSAEAAPPARLWAQRLALPLVHEGILEMVQTENGVRVVGRPWPEWHPNLWSPGTCRSLLPGLRCSLAGFRVICARTDVPQ